MIWYLIKTSFKQKSCLMFLSFYLQSSPKYSNKLRRKWWWMGQNAIWTQTQLTTGLRRDLSSLVVVCHVSFTIEPHPKVPSKGLKPRRFFDPLMIFIKILEVVESDLQLKIDRHLSFQWSIQKTMVASRTKCSLRPGSRPQRPLRSHVVFLHDVVLPSGARHESGCCWHYASIRWDLIALF